MVTLDTAFFWTAGAEGELRFQRCGNCGTLRHPPGPACGHCRSRESEVAAVSGRGTVVGVSDINALLDQKVVAQP